MAELAPVSKKSNTTKWVIIALVVILLVVALVLFLRHRKKQNLIKKAISAGMDPKTAQGMKLKDLEKYVASIPTGSLESQ